ASPRSASYSSGHSAMRGFWQPRAGRARALAPRGCVLQECSGSDASASERGGPMGELDGKVAVITGAGSGMAKVATRVFVREGAQVLAADISGDQEKTAAEVGGSVVPFQVDVSDEKQVVAMMDAAVRAFGKIDAVLNVAGVGTGGPLAEVDMAEYDRVLDV